MANPLPNLDPSDFQELGDCTCFQLRKAARAVSQLYDDTLRPAGLRVTQFTLLAAIRANQPVSVNQLAEATVTDRTTLTRNLKPLERRGLVDIARSGSDRRRRDVSLTPQGEEALAVAFPLWRKAQAIVNEGFSSDQLQDLRAGLEKTIEAVRA